MSSKVKDPETPLMKQYNAIKAKYPDAILLFRVGDFYETFSSDAVTTANILGIVLTRRANGAASFIELAGFPHHALDSYLPKLVKAGFRVAICDQLEDPKATKTIVKRGVTELVSPGITYNDKILDHKSNNFLASIHFDTINGIAFLDISTGEFFLAQGDISYIEKLIQTFKPSEIIFQKNHQLKFKELFPEKYYTYYLEDWILKPDYAREILNRHFGTVSLKGFGVEDLLQGIIAAGAALHYIGESQYDKLKHISNLARIDQHDFVWLDRFTIRNLELVSGAHEDSMSLLSVLDNTCTPMGARMLRKWILLPLKELQSIRNRQNSISHFLNEAELTNAIISLLKQIGDLERSISRVAMGKSNPREIVQIKRALLAISEVKDLCGKSGNPALSALGEKLNPYRSLSDKIEKEIVTDPPVMLAKGNVINSGISAELDELRAISGSGKQYLVDLQQRECASTGISSLKVAFNNVFGYYIEVTNTHKDKVPSAWIRKQTLVNAERYITPELKEYEEKILGAEEKIQALESSIFNEILLYINEFIQPIRYNAALISELDCLVSLARVAEKNQYTCPVLDNSGVLEIRSGRHPVIEKCLPAGEPYIANDIYLDSESQQIIMITGPNMSGKSAILRQTALIVLMAQMGSYIPAASANIGIVDKIFTRVGASDNISQGESTFMVEMNETASILNNLSDKSLILLDEIGRGTSTFDGISIAWAIAEFLHNHGQFKPRTLFATHYHELNEMEKFFPRIRNFHVSVKETDQRVIFLRKLIKGGSEHSFGIHVARMAGMPSRVVHSASEVLSRLEVSHVGEVLNKNSRDQQYENMQLSFFQLDDPVLEQIREEILNTDINTLTPVEALFKLNEIRSLLTGKSSHKKASRT